MRTLIALAVAVVASVSLVVPAAGSGAEPQARLLADIDPGGGSNPRLLTRVGELVFFSAHDATHGTELWATDGTAAGTRLVRDIHPGEQGSGPARLTRVGTRLYFSANDGTHGRELWVSDGSRAGTKLVKDLHPGSRGSSISGIAAGGGAAYVARAGRELWRSDGSARGTRLLRTFTGVDAQSGRWMGGRLFFSANDALWKTDGTRAGTKRLSPAYWGLDGITPFKGRIYYRAAPPLGAFGGLPQLWWSDGSWAGTERLGTMRNPTRLTPWAGSLWFVAQSSATTAPRLYRSDGTVKGTAPVVPRVRPLHSMARGAGHLWSTDDAPGEYEPDELWVSDGTAEGTIRLKGGSGDWFVYGWEGQGLATLDGRIWFAASPVEQVAGEAVAGDIEVWSSDGTPDGTTKAVDIDPLGSAYPRDIVRLGDVLVLSADDGTHGRELWRIAYH